MKTLINILITLILVTLLLSSVEARDKVSRKHKRELRKHRKAVERKSTFKYKGDCPTYSGVYMKRGNFKRYYYHRQHG